MQILMMVNANEGLIVTRVSMSHRMCVDYLHSGADR